jgi:hypothetical protein
VGDNLVLPTFSHLSMLPGRIAWPHNPDPQWYPHPPMFVDIWVYVDTSGFLEDRDIVCDNPLVGPNVFARGAKTGPLWLTRPWQPSRRRLWGFGVASVTQSCTYDTPNPVMMIHFIWTFLTPSQQQTMICSLSSWNQYARLRRAACCQSLWALHLPRSILCPTWLDDSRALLHSIALLRFDFDYGDFVRWLGGDYTNRHRDFSKEWDTILASPCRPLPADYPTPQYRLDFCIQTEDVPLCGHYNTPMETSCLREKYDNHPAVNENTAQVSKTFAKEEWKGYHVHFLRFLHGYIYGIILNPLQWVYDKGKGRICVDCTNGPDLRGAANTYIPNPSLENEEECPPVYYQAALHRLLNEFSKCKYHVRMSRSWFMRMTLRLPFVESSIIRI